ncbi:signal peptidase I [Myxococcota bacterium]|nr:signal peptidase I [Myxococcota bacterium]
MALLIRAMVVETFYVPSESMLPSLLIGDHVFVSKFSYGAHVPFTGIQLPALRDPERGEVVVFDLGKRGNEICPLDRCPDYPSESFVKRVIGLPGDTVELRGETVYVNDAPLPIEWTREVFEDTRGQKLRVGEEEIGGDSHLLLDHPSPTHPTLRQPRVFVPKDHYFMMGDNRDFSRDSRSWGFVPRADIRGPAVRIYWSWNNRESWAAMLNPLTWIRLLLYETRWGRTGEEVR